MYSIDFAADAADSLGASVSQSVARVMPSLGLAMVADGLGEVHSGEAASRLAAEVLIEGFGALGEVTSPEATEERLREAFLEANGRMRGLLGVGLPDSGTTLVVAVFRERHVIIASVGDSRCYRFRGRLGSSVIELLTRDHSYAEVLRQAGAGRTASRREAAEHWDHVLTRCLNGAASVAADTRVVDCQPGDIFLLSSYGLWGRLDEAAITNHLRGTRAAHEACQSLIDAALATGGSHQVGVAVARLAPLTLTAERPTSADQWEKQGQDERNASVDSRDRNNTI